MSEAFFISTNDREIERKAGEQATFAVCHREEEQQLIKVAVYAEPKRFEKWLKVKDPVERQMAPHQFEEYIVQLTPRDEARDHAPFEFGLRAMWEEDTDDKCTEGPRVKVKGVKKKRPWWIAALAGAVAVLLTAVIAVLVTRSLMELVEVPEVSSMPVATAQAALVKVGLKADSVTAQPDVLVQQGLVMATTPGPGNPVRKLSLIHI